MHSFEKNETTTMFFLKKPLGIHSDHTFYSQHDLLIMNLSVRWRNMMFGATNFLIGQ